LIPRIVGIFPQQACHRGRAADHTPNDVRLTPLIVGIDLVIDRVNNRPGRVLCGDTLQSSRQILVHELGDIPRCAGNRLDQIAVGFVGVSPYVHRIVILITNLLQTKWQNKPLGQFKSANQFHATI
jgi:hypothetical protein